MGRKVLRRALTRGRSQLVAGRLAAALCAAALAGPSFAAGDSWRGPGNESWRPGWRRGVAPSLDAVRWVANQDETGAVIAFSSQGGVAVSGDRLGNLVYAQGRVSRPGGPVNEARLIAFDRSTGQAAWSRAVASPVLDSLSTPCVDEAGGLVVYGSGRQVAAFDAVTGAPAWTCQLDRQVVNASPAATDDRPGRERLFITDYDGFGSAGSLYCLNLSPTSAMNPYAPGQVVWQVAIGGASGNSPAYLPRAEGGGGLVYVASVGELAGMPGRVFAFDVDAPLEPVWVTENPAGQGYFGGVCVAPARGDDPPAIYVASYSFEGGIDSGNLLKMDAATGALRWSVPCNRTQATPVVLPGSRVLISGGIRGFGTVPGIELFQDEGDHASPIWNTAVDSWHDLNQDGMIEEGEYLAVGGWTQQPACMVFGGRTRILAGVIPSVFNQPSGTLSMLDADASPADAGFVLGTLNGAGNSPAAGLAQAFSIGTAGLVAMGPTPDDLDVDRDGAVTFDDLYAWETGGGYDMNGDGAVTTEDRAVLIARLRKAGGEP